MKIAALVAIVLLIGAQAALSQTSPTDQAGLSQLVIQLQKTPSDNVLRERVIKLAAGLKPAPEIPEDARRSFVHANTAIKNASGSDDYANAIKQYQDALNIAPWWADAYYNLAKGQELHHDYDAAIQSLKFFLMTSPTQADAREAQDHIYALEELRDKKAVADKSQAVASAETNAKQRIVGKWRTQVMSPQGPVTEWLNMTERREGDWDIAYSIDNQQPYSWNVRDTRFENGELKFTKIDGVNFLGNLQHCSDFEMRAKVSTDGKRLMLDYKLLPLPSDRGPNCPLIQFKWQGSHVDEYTR